METIKFSKQNYKEIFPRAIQEIKNGKILVCPTDTVYGLICDAADKKAVEKMYKIKKRPKSKLFPIFIKDIVMAKKFVKVSSEQEKFMKKVWPGTVTVVIEKKKSALRIPRCRFIIDIIKKLNRPLIETSANISGEPATTKTKEVLKYFKGRKYQPDLILDGGNLKPAKPSRVIDLTGSKQKVLRK